VHRAKIFKIKQNIIRIITGWWTRESRRNLFYKH